MSSNSRSLINGQARLRTSSVVYPYDDQSVSEIDETRPLTSRNRSAKKVRICTCCGQCKGFRMPRYLFIILCIVLILLILLVAAIIVLYAVIPAIVRSTIDKAELNFGSLQIDQIQTKSFRLRADLIMKNTGSIPATIVPPLVITVNENVGIVTNNDPISISGSSSNGTVVPLNSQFQIVDMDAFNNFTRGLVFNSNVSWHLQAQATIRPISSAFLSYSNITLDKHITLKAFDGLHNVSISGLSLTRSTATRIIIDTTITIQNPSLFSIELGRLFFTLQYNNQTIGYVESNNSSVTLRPGANQIQVFGELQKSTYESYEAILDIIQNFLTQKQSDVTALAGPNCTSYPVFAAGMSGLTLGVKMPPFDKQLIASLSFESMSLVPSSQDKSVILSASISILINSPLGLNSPLDLQQMDMSVSLVYQNKPVGKLNLFGSPVTKLNATLYQSSFSRKILLLDGTGEAYETFAQDFILANDTNPIHFDIVGLASVIGSFALGPLHITGISVENNIALEGLNGLSDVTVDGISIDGEEGNALRLSVNTTITNQGITTVRLEDFTLTMADIETNTVMGRLPVDILEVRPGNNSIQLHGFLAPLSQDDLPVIGNFFSAYLHGIPQKVKLYHNKTSIENVTAMDLTVSGLEMKSNVNGIHTKLIRNVTVLNFGIEIDPDDVNRVFVTGRLSVLFVLPSNVNMTFKALSTSIELYILFGDEIQMARMNLVDLPVQHNQTTNILTMSFEKQELVVLNETAFEEFAANLVLTSNVSISIEGTASALAQVAIGNLTLMQLLVSDTVTLAGYNNFDNGLLKIDNVDITGALSNQSLALQVKTEIQNPSVVNIISGGRLLLDLCEMLTGTSLGLVTIDPFFLEPQNNATIIVAEGVFTMTDNNTRVSRNFISNMISGIDNFVELRGTLEDNSTGTTIPFLKLAIAGLRIHTVVHGLTGSNALVQELLVKRLTAAEIAGITVGLVKMLHARIRIVNPFNTSLTIHSIDVKADYGAKINDDLQVGFVHDQTPLYVQPYEEFISPYVNVTIAAKLTTLATMIVPLLDGHAHLSLYGSISCTMGDNGLDLNELPEIGRAHV